MYLGGVLVSSTTVLISTNSLCRLKDLLIPVPYCTRYNYSRLCGGMRTVVGVVHDAIYATRLHERLPR